MKTKRILKSLVCAALTGAMALSMFSTMNVNAEETETLCMKSVMDRNVDLKGYFEEVKEIPTTYATLPSSVDLSTSPCFPDIGNQGDFGSCIPFATTYYQYSYEVNKLNGVTSKNDRVIYSPKWTYNLSNEGRNIGSIITDVYKILEDFGALKNSDFPYTTNEGDFAEWPSGLDEQKIEALQTRVENKYMYDIPDNHVITNVNDSYISGVKQLLNSGKVLVVGSDFNWNATTQNGESVAFRCYKKDENNIGHVMTVVGYDDNKCYDVNGNGTIEPTEKGAFKIANSWSNSFIGYGVRSNTGYFWVMYDALNETSATPNWKINYAWTRVPAFKYYETGNNTFFYIDVAHKDVNLIGKLDVNTSNREKLKLKINRTTSGTWTNSGAKELYPYNGYNGDSNEKISFNGRIYFDYDSYASPIYDYITGYNWFSYISGAETSDKFTFGILDNLGNVIAANKTLTRSGNTAYGYHNLSFLLGDVDFDGILTENDANVMTDYILMHIEFSNIQYYLGDYNKDGRVSPADIVEIRKAVAGNNS